MLTPKSSRLIYRAARNHIIECINIAEGRVVRPYILRCVSSYQRHSNEHQSRMAPRCRNMHCVHLQGWQLRHLEEEMCGWINLDPLKFDQVKKTVV